MRQWLRLSICTLAVGCINTNVQHLDDAPRLARSPDSVRVLLEEPQQPYTVFIFTGTAMIKSDKRRLTGKVIVYDQGG
jgi:hypothetical protein